MEGILGLMNIVRHEEAAKEPEIAPVLLIRQIKEVERRLDIAYRHFDQETDPDLIDACIYEIEALKARYRHLNRVARENAVTCGPAKQPWLVRKERDLKNMP